MDKDSQNGQYKLWINIWKDTNYLLFKETQRKIPMRYNSNFFNVYLFLREREGERQSVNDQGAEREGDTESKAGSRLWAVSTEPDVELGMKDHEIMIWAKVRALTDWATQAPHLSIVIAYSLLCLPYIIML